MRNNETGEFELIVGNRQLLSGFFIVVLLFAVAFAMGYVVGQNSPRSSQSDGGNRRDAARFRRRHGRRPSASPRRRLRQQPPAPASRDRRRSARRSAAATHHAARARTGAAPAPRPPSFRPAPTGR